MSQHTTRPFRVAGVLFDFDETLTAPGAIDFAVIRQRIGCPEDEPILEYIAAMSSDEQRLQALEVVHEVQIGAAAAALPNEGAEDLVHWLQERGLPVGVQTRNSRKSVERALANFPGLSMDDFVVVITRDDPVPHKPEPDGVLQVAQVMGVPAEQVLVVGDYVFDIEAGRRAGAVTALLENAGSMTLPDLPDFRIQSLADVPYIVRMGTPLPAGKAPSDLLERFLDALPFDDPSVLIPPKVGEDVTVVDARPGGLIALGADPVTFTVEDIGRWALLVNANDIAVCGAKPSWFLATVLLPVGSTPSQVVALLSSLAEACVAQGVTLCGGHTEITDSVTRPVVSGTMLGLIGERGLIDKRDLAPGDAVILTKRIAAEGTALLATEMAHELTAAGLEADELDACLALRDLLSIAPEAHIALEVPGVHAMHDVTEGGLATAVSELASVGGHTVIINIAAIPYFPQTSRVCELLGVDPLGLIGSGSLLICCEGSHSDDLLQRLAAADIEATVIGTVVQGPPQVTLAVPVGASSVWPTFAVDEVARMLGGRPTSA